MGESYTLAHGAKHNVGDFLIRDRAIALIEAETGVPKEDLYLTDLVRNHLSDREIDRIADTDAVIIGGGPAYQPNFHPGTYPDIDKILEMGIPVIPLGPGWKGRRTDSYEFTDTSKRMLRRIHDKIEVAGVRDLPTKRVLEDIGVDNAELVGCPAWYNLDLTSTSFDAPDTIDSLVVSSPQKGDLRYGPQWAYLLSQLAQRFPEADRYCSFHHGIPHVPGYRNRRTAAYNRLMARVASRLGYTIIDPSGQPDKLDLYDEIDLHAGYRVHGHIHFISAGKPSFLLQQDGRGTGVSESLRTANADVNAFSPSIRGPVDELMSNIDRNQRTGFADFSETGPAITASRDRMNNLLGTLP